MAKRGRPRKSKANKKVSVGGRMHPKVRSFILKKYKSFQKFLDHYSKIEAMSQFDYLEME